MTNSVLVEVLGNGWTYVFCLSQTLPPLLLLVMDMVETCCDSVAIIFRSAVISLEILVLDPLSVALEWVSS